MTWRAPLVPLLVVCGCAVSPLPVEEAEWRCLDDLRQRPRTGVVVAGGTGGVGVGLSLDIPAAALRRGDPSATFDACVRRRAGMPPVRPLAQQPGWPG